MHTGSWNFPIPLVRDRAMTQTMLSYGAQAQVNPHGTFHLGWPKGKGNYSNDKYYCLCYARHSTGTVVNTVNNEPMALTLVLGRCGKGRDSYKMCCDYKVSHRRRRSWGTVRGSRGDIWERAGAGPRVADRWGVFRTKTWRSTSCGKGQSTLEYSSHWSSS
jgi:hypothetical protein